MIEDSIPSDPGRERFLQEESPDVVLVSPLVRFGSEQSDWVKSAKALGIPVGFPVFSWDNLTTKGVIHVEPDRVFVWNAVQKREATEYDGIPSEKVVITGAPRFDSFMELRPSVDRDAYCQSLNLDPAAPIVTYLCSSEFVAGHEVAFVEQWIAEIRNDPRLSSCNVIVRPHPRSVRQWSEVDLARHGRVGLSLSRVLNADQSLYDALHHSAAVVGLNTSAQIEAGILGKPVLTLLAPASRKARAARSTSVTCSAKKVGSWSSPTISTSTRRISRAPSAEVTTSARFAARSRDSSGPRVGIDLSTPILATAITDMAPEKPSVVRRWLHSATRAGR